MEREGVRGGEGRRQDGRREEGNGEEGNGERRTREVEFLACFMQAVHVQSEIIKGGFGDSYTTIHTSGKQVIESCMEGLTV